MINITHLIEQKNLLRALLYLDLGLGSEAKDEIKIYNYFYKTKKNQTKKQNDITEWLRYFLRRQAKFILELNLLITQNGFSTIKNAGIVFQKKINILMEELENYN